MNIYDQYSAPLADLERMSAAAGARADYVQGGGGNTSVKFGGMMAIKASGYKLSQVTAQDGYAVLDMKALDEFFGHTDPATLEDVEKAGTAAVKASALAPEGIKQLRPSVEAGFHSLLNTFVLHTHCVWANIAACAEDGKAEIAKALEGSGLDWCFVRYVNPGAALTFEIKAAIDQYEAETGRRPGLIFMQNHGLIATAATADEATRLHAAASELMARHYGLSMDSFPWQPLAEQGEEQFESNCAYLKEKLATGKYGAKELLDDALYPDQMVFFKGSVELRKAGEEPTAPCNIYPDGSIIYRSNRASAEAIDQTLTCVVFIRETLAACGQVVTPMNQASQSFIANWEAEAARRKMMTK